jgi:hypothetical protein
LVHQLTEIANNPSLHSAQQLIVNNNYHNIFNLDQQLIDRSESWLRVILNDNMAQNISNSYFPNIITDLFQMTMHEIISAFMMMIDNTRNLVLNYELFNANSTAMFNSILNIVNRNFHRTEDADWADG